MLVFVIDLLSIYLTVLQVETKAADNRAAIC